jgi:hypothetical protein
VIPREDPAARPWALSLAAQASAIALFAATLEQIVHEVTHGVAGVIVGKRWEALHFFACLTTWPGEASPAGDGVVAGSAAIVNLLCAAASIALLARGALPRRPLARLLLFYFAAFSLLSGFGYLMVDPLFYNPEGDNLGDWKKIVALLGGGWAVRAPIAAIGAAGSLWGFFWLPRAALGFRREGLLPSDRGRFLASLVVAPYVMVNIVFGVFSLWHPLGASGVVVVLMKGVMGYSAFVWAPLIARSGWMPRFPAPGATVLPPRIHGPWLVAALVAVGLAASALLPVLRF